MREQILTDLVCAHDFIFLKFVELTPRCPHDARTHCDVLYHSTIKPAMHCNQNQVFAQPIPFSRKQAPEARPAALYIKKHLEVLENELRLTSNETYRQSQMSWRQDCEYDEYEFDMEEIKQWCKDLECYRLLQMR